MLGLHHILILHSIIICAFPFTWEACQDKGHSFIFRSRGVLWHFGTRGAPSRGSSDPTAEDEVGNWAKSALSVAFLGNLHELNATGLLLCRNRVGVTPLTHELFCSPQNHTSSISRSPFLVPFCLKIRCLKRGWGWRVFACFRGTEFSRWYGTGKDGTDSS